MNAVVLVKDRTIGQEIKKLLQEAGMKKVMLATERSAANAAVGQVGAFCVFFERSFAGPSMEGFEAFYQKFTNSYVCFVPMSKLVDNRDVVEALNAGRTAYYLALPPTQDSVAEAVRCLRQRINRYQNVIFFPQPAPPQGGEE